jgi:hypothetical protein
MLCQAQFARALQLAASQRVAAVAGVDGDALTPLPVREAPVGSLAAEEVVEELVLPDGAAPEPEEGETVLVNFVSRDGAPLPAARELVLDGGRRNDVLLLEAGYVWDDVGASAMPLRMWLGSAKSKAEHSIA